MNGNTKKQWWLLFLAILIVVGGSLLTWAIDTVGGSVDVKLVDFVGLNGTVLHARLYVPKGVTSENPAPGVLFIHGGDASSDKYSMFSVEFARRGYVVLNLDQRGHGFSGGEAEIPFGPTKYGMGGPETLKYFSTLDIVDPDNIACVGHSMGGMACAAAAVAHPDIASAFVFVGSTPPEGTDTTFPPNAAAIAALDDSARHGESTLLPLVGVTDIGEVSPGAVYGSIEEGTGRVVYKPDTIHNAEYITPAVIEAAVDWIQQTMTPPKNIAPSNQIWYWRYIGSSIALGGAIFFMVSLGSLLLQTTYFKPLAEPLPEFKGAKGVGWWIAAIITAIVAPATLFYFHGMTAKSVGKLWYYNRITGIMGWTVLVAVVTVILLLINHYLLKADKGATAYNYGLTWKEKLIDWVKIGKSLLLAFCIISATYLLVAIIYNVLQVDLRMWNEGLRLMTLHKVGDVLKYVIPFMLGYIVFAANLHGLLRPKDGSASLGREMLTNILILAPWYYLWAIWWGPFSYLKTHPGGPPFAQGFMQHWFWALPPVMLAWTVISTYFYRKTGKVYVGAFVNALFVCWVILAEQMMAAFLLG
ncbi:MAG: alpha/beta fold hydrolase [Anaerolineales bacterium]|jgi:pimeloyl-ACP methyl ester carboxylesterase